MNENDLYHFYQNKFKPLYADLVAIRGGKSLEIDAQIESAMSHLSVGKTSDNAQEAQSHIDSAYGHVGRACLDAAKLLWLSRHGEIKAIMDDELKRKWCANVGEGKLFDMYNRANRAAMQARREDATASGHDYERLADLYYESVNISQNFLDTIDWDKLESIKKFRLIYIFKQQSSGLIIGFISGILSSTLVALGCWKYLPPQPTEASPNQIVTPSVVK